MTWVRIDDGAPLHPKLLDAGPEAAWLWLAGLAHCNRCHTNGRISERHLPSLFPDGTWSRKDLARLADRLVSVRLWHREEDGYRVHDYEDFQSEATREAVDDRRQYERSRKAEQRARRRGVPDMSGTCPGQEHAKVPDLSHPVPRVSQPPVPSRPAPSRPVLPSVGGVQGNQSDPGAPAGASAGPDADAPPCEDTTPRAARRPRQPRAPAAPETAPLPGTDARRVFDAVTVDRALGARLRSPAAWSERVTAGAFPALGVHGIVREIARAGAWVADQPPSKAPRDAGAFLRNWLARADRDAASDPRAGAAAEPRRPRLPPPPVRVPPPPPSTPEQRQATDALIASLRDDARRRAAESRIRVPTAPVGADLEDDHD